MKKWGLGRVGVGIVMAVVVGVPVRIYAAEGLIKAGSRWYFLQTWKEKLRLVLVRSEEQKLNYLLTLTDKRVEEMEAVPTAEMGGRYEDHFRELNELVSKIDDEELAADRIRAASLRQQQELARVYSRVPEAAKGAVLEAQENSARHVAQTIERVAGAQEAREYIQQVERWQQMEKVGQAELVEQAAMEGAPNSNPAETVPKELKGTNPLMPGQELNPVNEGLDGGQGMEPAVPIEMNAPAGQN